jgi:hemerythrin
MGVSAEAGCADMSIEDTSVNTQSVEDKPVNAQCEPAETLRFELPPELLVDILEIDTQHLELLDRAGVLGEAINAAKPRQEIEALLSALIDFTEMHFRTEEEMMLTHGYAGYEEHKAAHESLLGQIRLAAREFSAGEIARCHLLSQFIQSWAEEHITDLDKKFSAFLKSKGAASVR